jgi:hypothetical protein
MFFTPFSGFSSSNPAADFWTKAYKEQLAKAETMQKEAEKLEAQTWERTLEALDESSKLTKESFAYAQKLSAEWRRITLETLKKSSEACGVQL